MSRDGKEQNPSSANNYNGCMDQDNDEDVDLNNHNNDRLDIEIQTPPNTKRIRLMDNSELSDDNTLSTTTFGSCNGEQPSISPQLKYHNHQNNNTGSIGSNRNHVHNQQMIDLGVEFPALPNVLNPKDIQQELQLDPKFDLGQFSKQHNQNDNNNAISNISNKVNVNMNDKMNDNLSSFPMIFDWDKLKEATDPQQLRTEALRKQERGKYVRRDSLSSEQAADRRRRQNRESARRTRDRVRKYITVLEMYYGHVQKVNSLLIKQLEIMAKHCSNQLTDKERQNLQMHKWPEPPSIEECINAKPATISATSCGKKGEESPKISPKQHPIERKKKTNSNQQIKTIRCIKSAKIESVNPLAMKFEGPAASNNDNTRTQTTSLPLLPQNPLNLPKLNLSQTSKQIVDKSSNKKKGKNGSRMAHINVMQIKSNKGNASLLNNKQNNGNLNKCNKSNTNNDNELSQFEKELFALSKVSTNTNMNNINNLNNMNNINNINNMSQMNQMNMNMMNMNTINNTTNMNMMNMMNGDTSVNRVIFNNPNMIPQMAPIAMNGMNGMNTMNTMNMMNVNGQPTQVIMAPMAFTNGGGTMLALTSQGLQNVAAIPAIPTIPIGNVMPSPYIF